MARKRNRRKIPEVLWRIYGNRARTLEETVIDLLPKPLLSCSDKCRCKGNGCLGCSGSDPKGFLLRRSDPKDYFNLLTRSFAVVSNTAPHVQSFSFDMHWTQEQVVKRTIESIIGRNQNVICNGYKLHQCNQSNKVLDLLTTSAWNLFHNRIGDEVMVHLFKFVSIFLPLAGGNHYQVSGYSINGLCPKFSKKAPVSTSQHHLSHPTEHPIKRKKTDYGDKYNMDAVNCHVGFKQKKHIRCTDWSCQTGILEPHVPNTCLAIIDDKNKMNGEPLRISSTENTNLNKRARPYRWQRCRKRRQLDHTEVLAPCASANGRETSAVKTEQNINISSNFQPMKSILLRESEKKHTVNLCSQVASCQCFCFRMLQEPRHVALDAQIDRSCIFYKFNSSSSLFPRKHILNMIKNNHTGAIFVFKDIFGLSDEEWKHFSLHCFDKCHYCLEGSGCIYHSFIELIKGLIRKSRSCQYSKLMGKYCTVPALEQMAMGEAQPTPKGYLLETKLLQTNCVGVQKECIMPPKNLKSQENIKQQKHCQRISRVYGLTNELSGSYCLKSHVVSFIWAVCRNIVPVQLLGAPSNWRALRRNISMFVNLRRFEKFSLKQCMQGLKTSFIPLLSNSYSSCYLNNHAFKKTENMFKGCQNFSETIALLKNKIFSCWVYWFFSRLVVPIIQANFYVTEVEDGKRELFYYPKAIWEKLFARGVASLREQNYSLLNQETLLHMLGKRSFGFSKVRFCPKENGIRVLANLKAPSILPARRFKSVNGVLRDLNAVLKGLKLTDPEKLGSSVFDYNDVYEKLCPFIIGLKRNSSKMPRVYIVICDISKAFDSVNQDKLLAVMENVMLNKEYSLESVSEVLCTKKSTWVHQEQRLSNQNMSIATVKFATSVPLSVMHRVRVNQEARKTVTKAQLYQDLQEHVKGNVLQLQKKFYLQEVGIPQGSAVSSLLCSFYYAHLEEKVIFPFLKKVQDQSTSKSAKGSSFERNICQGIEETEKGNSSMSPKNVLVRFIDDFLFISTSKHMATSFFERVQRGFSGYSCSINKAKSCMNFNIAGFSGLQSKRVYTGNDGISFLPWSGLLINCCTLEILADYTRYLDIHLSSSLTVCWQGKPGCFLKRRLFHYMQPKCHPILYDSNINSAPVVRLNIYQAFLLCSMKFHCYVCNLATVCILRAEQHYKMIISSLRYMHKLLKKRMYSMKTGANVHPTLKLKKEEVVWLGLKAYIRVLKRKQPRHTQLLSLLRAEFLRSHVVETSSMKYAVDDSHSSLFWKIKY